MAELRTAALVLAGALLTSAQPVEPPGRLPWKGALENLWSHFAARHGARLALHAHEIAGLESQADQVRTTRRVTQQGALSIGEDGVTEATGSLRASRDDWGAEASAAGGEDGIATSRLGAFRTFFSGRGRRAEILDSLAALERKRLRLEGENLLFSQWKAVLSEKASYDLLDAEIAHRKESLLQLSEVEALLGKLHAEGEVSAGVLNPIALFRLDNDVRIRNLEAQKAIQRDLVRARYRLPESLFLALQPDSLERVLAPWDPSGRPYDHAIDSLLVAGSRLRIRYAGLPRTGMDLGAGLDFGGLRGPEDVRLYARLGMDFEWFDRRPLPKVRDTFPRTPLEGPSRGGLDTIDLQVARFGREADRQVSQSLEKMKHGQIGSAFEIADMIRRRLDQKSQMRQLQASRLQALLASLETLQQLSIIFPVPP